MQFELATPADEPQLRRLLREVTVPGTIELSLEREPCIDLGNAIEGEPHQTIVARTGDGAPIVAMGSRTIALRYVNGVPTRVAYLGQLRIAKAWQANPALLSRGYRLLRQLHRDAAVPWSFTTIVSDNLTARRVLEAGLRGMPKYEPIDELVTMMIHTCTHTSRRPVSSTARPATADDIDAIVACVNRYGRRYQFARTWTREDLMSNEATRGLRIEDFVVVRRGGAVIGCLACWDQRSFKQAVVRGYSRALAGLRPLNNLLASLTGAPRLPPIGTAVPFAWLSHLGLDDDDPDTLRTLLNGALATAQARGLSLASLDLSAHNPLSESISRHYRLRAYRSRIYVVSWQDAGMPAAALTGRLCHPEAAVL